MKYTMQEIVEQTFTYTVELPEGATFEEIKEAAYKTAPKITFDSLEDTDAVFVYDENGRAIYVL